MARRVHRDDVRRLAAQGARIVDVLSERAYLEEHIAGAVNVPLGRLGREAPKRLAPDRPVVLYCYDFT